MFTLELFQKEALSVPLTQILSGAAIISAIKFTETIVLGVGYFWITMCAPTKGISSGCLQFYLQILVNFTYNFIYEDTTSWVQRSSCEHCF